MMSMTKEEFDAVTRQFQAERDAAAAQKEKALKVEKYYNEGSALTEELLKTTTGTLAAGGQALFQSRKNPMAIMSFFMQAAGMVSVGGKIILHDLEKTDEVIEHEANASAQKTAAKARNPGYHVAS